MNRPAAVIYALAIVGVGVLILVPKDKESDTGTAPSAPLNYSKPVFSTSVTVVCPLALLSDIRADHSPEKVIDMFGSFLSRSDKAKALGCEELQEGILVSASPFDDGIVSVGLPGGLGSGWFTIASELTNKVPGQSDAERQELTAPHIAKAADQPLSPASTSPSSAGHLLVNMPSLVPIPKGAGIAATDSSGSGALICPDENRLAAVADYAVDTPREQKLVNKWEEYTRFGCSYVPPGTEMISQGANEHGSLAVVTAKMPDGTRIHGVTFPSMFIKNLVHREESLGQRPAEAKGAEQLATDEFREPQRTQAQENGIAEESNVGPFVPGTNGVGYPSCIYCPDPQFTAENRASGISGIVTLKIVAETDGHATDIQVVKSLGHGLDELAVETVKKWRFEAALGPTGIPVPTIVPVEITFRLN